MKLSELASLLCTDAHGLAAFADRGQNEMLTDAEAEDISTAWVAETERLKAEAPVQVEYREDGGETIHEYPALDQADVYNPGRNSGEWETPLVESTPASLHNPHYACDTATNFMCPTGEHQPMHDGTHTNCEACVYDPRGWH